MDEYLQTLSPLSVFTMLLLLGVLSTTILLLGVRHFRSTERMRRDHEVVSATFTVVGALYGVLLGFIVVTVYNEYSHASEVVEAEGVSLRNLHRDSFMLPATNQVAIRQALLDYTRAVVGDEWRSLRRAQESPRAREAMEAVWQAYYHVQPVTGTEKIWAQESVTKLDEFAGQRRLRILAASQTIGWVMWAMLIFGGLVTTGFMVLFGVEQFHSHLLMTASLLCLILLILYVIYSLDNPYWGEMRITPEPFVRFLQLHPTP